MINIKEKIGQRILEARKAKGLTRKALADLTDDLKQSRINNWERGIRTPGPEEIKQLAKALDVSPAFLMCLSEVNHSQIKNPTQLIPLLDHCEAANISSEHNFSGSVNFIAISTYLLPKLGEKSFAIKMKDDSMCPAINIDNMLIIDPSVSPIPGDFVLVKLEGKPETIICQYKKLSFTSSEFELITLNDNWPNIKVCKNDEVKIVGKAVQSIINF